ncbi:hypothetical protein PPL_00683 [Heterostelium album PN500]|uniref:Uncharacterized protein n=1 Tax=Heterostelium pallidum (strain ATCC 26659 / Pp 5 / PN500) TaxID=670386 RepID=D3AX54_HETP5|nr:hypothetical protein PPL_00683 [Heterostelium album PN500]EFA86123.1 hypothetical protein PPL_00683 [Heterostelium album PN500]|eukprot:XP_020438228.1 hypothetical protein PPL_00683 [Heterostelium album PN500]
MTIIHRAFHMSVLLNTLQVNSYINNIVSGTFDVEVKVHESSISEEFTMDVWMRRDQLTKPEKLLNKEFKLTKEQLSQIIRVPFTLPVSDEAVLRVVVIRHSSFRLVDVGLYLIDDRLYLESHSGRVKRLKSLGYGDYSFSDDQLYFSDWPAFDSYSVDTITDSFFGYGYQTLVDKGYINTLVFDSEFYSVPTVEQFVAIVCNKALREHADSIDIYYSNTYFKNFRRINVPGNDIGQFDAHELLDLLRLGFQHWIDLSPAINNESHDETDL